MRISKTSEYAVRILCYMANSEKSLHNVSMILQTMNIPPKYLRRIMTDLCKYKFIQSVKGRDGGFKFLIPPEEIFLADIIDAVEGLDNYHGCLLGLDECSCENPCAVHAAYFDISKEIIFTLKNTSLADLKNKKIIKF